MGIQFIMYAMPKVLDTNVIFIVSSSGSSLRLFKTTMGTTFELFHPNPPNYDTRSPLLRMYEDPKNKDIFYQDQSHNFYRPILPPDLSEEEEKGSYLG